MAYTSIDDPALFFNTVLYTGTEVSGNSVTGVGFQPDWVWIKNRTDTTNHNTYDVVRGGNGTSHYFMKPNTGVGEGTNTSSLLTLDSDGFTLGDGNEVNGNNDNIVSWNWKAGGSASSNSDGTITSSVSANTTSGFSIVGWSGNSGTVGHGLGIKPAVIIIKSRSTTNNWVILHKDLTSGMDEKGIVFNSTNGEDSLGAGVSEPTSSVFTVTGGMASNDSQIGYCLVEKQGYSKFGSYTGNGDADGRFVYTGFKPAFVMTKYYSGNGHGWHMQDNKRDGFNYNNHRLFANSTGGEETSVRMEFLCNGFKYRDNDGNGNGFKYIYFAFAESPFVNSNGIPNNPRG